MTAAVQHPRDGEQGYLLLWLVVVCFLLLLALGVAAPRAAKELERDRELESAHRAQEYVRAIQLYYRKNGTYPTSIDQLLGSGTSGVTSSLSIKYLRQQYKDPLTRGDFRLIHVGEAKTEVKGFFGDPLPGVVAGNLGSAAGSQSNLSGSSTFGSSSSAFGSSGSSFGSSGQATAGSTAAGGSAAGSTASAGGLGSTSASTGTSAPGTDSGTGTSTGTSTSATSFQGSKGGIVGVGSDAKGQGLVEWNGSENIEDWEFLYDPRVDAMKAKVSILGGAPAAVGSGSSGSGFAPAAGITTPNSPAGTFGAPVGSAGSAGSSTTTGTTPSNPNP